MIVTFELHDPECDVSRIVLGPGHYKVGKAAGADIPLKTAFSSRNHGLIEISSEGVIYKDNNSTNGTLFEGEKILDPILLQEDDVLVIGPAQITIIEIDNALDELGFLEFEPEEILNNDVITDEVITDEVETNKVLINEVVNDEPIEETPAALEDSLQVDESNLVVTALSNQSSDDEGATSIMTDLDFTDLLPILADDAVSSLMINGHSDVYIKRNGAIKLVSALSSTDIVEPLVASLLNQMGVVEGSAQSVFSGQMSNGYHYHVVMAPIAAFGPHITITKPCRFYSDVKKPVEVGACSSEMMSFLTDAVKSGCSILVCGADMDQRIRWLNVLSGLLAPDRRIVSIESDAPLKLNLPHCLSLSGPSLKSFDVKRELKAGDYLSAAAGLKPESLVVNTLEPELLSGLLLHGATQFAGVQVISSVTAASIKQLMVQWQVHALDLAPGMTDTLLSEALLNRFDLVVTLESRPNEAWERLVSIHELVSYDSITDASSTLVTLSKAVAIKPVFEFSQRNGRFTASDSVPSFYRKLGIQPDNISQPQAPISQGLHVGLGAGLSE